MSLAWTVRGDDWPQWRGPHRDGLSRETHWLDQGRPEPLWSRNVGLGHSSFSIADGRLYTLGYDADAKLDTVYCLDPETGEEIWTYSYPSEIWDSGHTGGTLTTPAVDGDVVYTSNREGRLFCFDAATGDIRWQRHLGEEFELTPYIYGFAASPLVLDDMLVMNVDRTIAFDKATGEEIWLTEDLYGRAFSTPVDFELDGQSRLAVFNGVGLVVLDRGSGRELGRYPWSRNSETNPATPIVMGNRIFISAGYNDGCALVELDETGLTSLWESRVMRTKVGTCLLIDDHLYGFDESMLKCIDLQGNEQWRVRGLGMGSLTAAGDRLIIMTGRGELIVADAAPEAFRERSRTRILEGGTYWSTPVLHEGRIYCRNSGGDVVCLDHRPREAAVARDDEAGRELPAVEAELRPADLFVRHRDAIGGPGALPAGTCVRLSGAFDRRAEGSIAHPMRLYWRSPGEWMLEIDDPRGMVAYGIDDRGGWTVLGPGNADVMTEGDLLWLSETAGIVTWFDPDAAAPEGQLTGVRDFEAHACNVLRVPLPEGGSRDLFFDVETGRRRGQDGETTPLVVYSDYETFDGFTIPTRLSVFESDTGIMQSLRIEEVAIGDEIASELAPPAELATLPRTEEDIAAANAEARRRFSAILGRYQVEEERDEPRIYTVLVRRGRLAVESFRGDVFTLHEPDAEGRYFVVQAPDASLTFTIDESGRATGMMIHQDELHLPLIRLPDEPEP